MSSIHRDPWSSICTTTEARLPLQPIQHVSSHCEPRSTEYFRDWSLVYNLGRERGFMAIDSEWLVVRIGVGEEVKREVRQKVAQRRVRLPLHMRGLLIGAPGREAASCRRCARVLHR